jgi:hypothetical protein
MQIYAEMIGNVMIDARSTGKYYHCMYMILENFLELLQIAFNEQILQSCTELTNLNAPPWVLSY